MTAYTNQVLVALATEHAESRRPVATLIVMAACNAATAAQQDRTLVALASLKRQGLVAQHFDRWEVSPAGHGAARQLVAQQPAPAPTVEPVPMESGFKPRRGRDTLRQTVGGAARPVTRPEPAPTVKESLLVAADHGPAGEHCGLPAEAPNHFADASNMAPALLDRCAAMHLALLAQVRAAYEAGDSNADLELAWLLETGEQLLAAGGGR